MLIFLNILPYTKHFHIITAFPNVFLGDLTPRGRLRPLAKTTEELMGKVEKASEGEDTRAARIGYARIEHFTWKDVLDFYTCTECGRCSDNCPATNTGKLLSPKHLTLDLRDHLNAEARGHDRSRAERHQARGALGLHDLPRLRGAVPGDHHATSTRSCRCGATW